MTILLCIWTSYCNTIFLHHIMQSHFCTTCHIYISYLALLLKKYLVFFSRTKFYPKCFWSTSGLDTTNHGQSLMSYAFLYSFFKFDQQLNHNEQSLIILCCFRFFKGKTPYSMTKVGMTVLVHGLAKELKDTGECTLKIN